MKVRIPQGPSQQELLRKVQQAQENMEKKQEELNNREFEVTSGGGMVKITIMGTKEVKSIKIDPAVVSNEPEDMEMLEDMLVAAVNEAVSLVEKTTSDEMGKITGGLNLPGMPGMGF
ncbi:MAG: YbaB/EbfC family nucleoid-associated protein [Ruminococcaceae bacterium]|nr:YbaB/EbfC family nucleoid-associated protein [Oscillospiraceae bacterium]